MTATIAAAAGHLLEAAEQFRVATIGAGDDALLAALRACETAARRHTVAADQVVGRTGLDGIALPPTLPATATLFAGGETSLRHTEVVASVLGTAAAGRLDPGTWAAAEVQLAEQATACTPAELHTWGTRLIEALDQDGPEPDERPDPEVNELRLVRHRDRSGGRLTGRFDDATMFDAIATVLDATAAPRTADETREPAERAAEALAEVCGFVLDHVPTSLVPGTVGRRPRLEDLEHRARSAMLDFGDGARRPADVEGLSRAAEHHRRGRRPPAQPGCAHPPSRAVTARRIPGCPAWSSTTCGRGRSATGRRPDASLGAG